MASKKTYSVLERITPKRAQELLDCALEVQTRMIARGEKTLQNRPENQNNIIKIALDITEGRWVVNGETISISPEGDPLNGQHRLKACILAGLPFETWVIYNVPRETFSTFDSGLTRSTKDVLSIEGKKSPAILAGVLARVLQYEKGVLGLASPGAITNTQKVELSEQYPEIDKFVKKATKFPWQKVIVASTFYLFSREYPTKTAEFFEQLKEGVGLAADSPVYRLREKLNKRQVGTRLRQEVVMNYFFVALNAFINDRPLNQLRLAAVPLKIEGPKQKKAASAGN